MRERKTLVLLDASPCFSPNWKNSRNPGLSRLARILARNPSVEVWVAGWTQVYFHNSGVFLRGPLLGVSPTRSRRVRAIKPRRVDWMLSYPVSGAGTAERHGPEGAALRRWKGMGIETSGKDRQSLLARILEEAGRRGVVTNTPGFEGRLGRKDQLEYSLRAYRRETGRTILRPETVAALGAQVSCVRDSFHRRGKKCLLKPANRSRGEGILILPSVVDIEPEAAVVIQELIQNPLIVKGRKADLRCYVLVDTADGAACRRVGPVFLRLAARPYRAGQEAAEITNTSYRRRHGWPSAIFPLKQVIGMGSRQTILSQLNALVEELLRFRFWLARERNESARRVLLWGVDVLPAWVGKELKLFLLEVNVHPQLFRGDALCDGLTEKMVMEDYLPVLLPQGRFFSIPTRPPSPAPPGHPLSPVENRRGERDGPKNAAVELRR